MAPIPPSVELGEMKTRDAATRLAAHIKWQAIDTLALAQNDITMVVPTLKKIYDDKVKNPADDVKNVGAAEIDNAAKFSAFEKAAEAYLEYRKANKDSGKMKPGENRSIIEELKKAKWNNQLFMLERVDDHIEGFIKTEYPKHEAARTKAIAALMPDIEKLIQNKAYYKPATEYSSKTLFEYRVLNDAVDAIMANHKIGTLPTITVATPQQLDLDKKIKDIGTGALPGKAAHAYAEAMGMDSEIERMPPAGRCEENGIMAPSTLPLKTLAFRKSASTVVAA